MKITANEDSSLSYVPLKQVKVEANVRSFVADVTITHVFAHNDSACGQVSYWFPVEEHAAIYDVRAQIDDRELVAALAVKPDARIGGFSPMPDAASERCVPNDEKCTVHMGALPAWSRCQVTVSYAVELDFIRDSIIRFVLPKMPAPPPSRRARELLVDVHAFEFRCRVEKILGPFREPCIARIQSPSHPVDIDLSVRDAYIVTYTQNSVYLHRDILVDVRLIDRRAHTFVTVEPSAAMVVVTPFDDDARMILNKQRVTEWIFLVDCSSSMRKDQQIDVIREILTFSMQCLPGNAYFNIVLFGSIGSCLFSQTSVACTRVNVRIAEKLRTHPG